MRWVRWDRMRWDEMRCLWHGPLQHEIAGRLWGTVLLMYVRML